MVKQGYSLQHDLRQLPRDKIENYVIWGNQPEMRPTGQGIDMRMHMCLKMHSAPTARLWTSQDHTTATNQGMSMKHFDLHWCTSLRARRRATFKPVERDDVNALGTRDESRTQQEKFGCGLAWA
jgi:hypothetical protein